MFFQNRFFFFVVVLIGFDSGFLQGVIVGFIVGFIMFYIVFFEFHSGFFSGFCSGGASQVVIRVDFDRGLTGGGLKAMLFFFLGGFLSFS